MCIAIRDAGCGGSRIAVVWSEAAFTFLLIISIIQAFAASSRTELQQLPSTQGLEALQLAATLLRSSVTALEV